MEGRQEVKWTRGWREVERAGIGGVWEKEVQGSKELDAGRTRRRYAGVLQN